MQRDDDGVFGQAAYYTKFAQDLLSLDGLGLPEPSDLLDAPSAVKDETKLFPLASP